MEWSDAQRGQLRQELERIGYESGELWPSPAWNFAPEEFLALYARIPDGAGRRGYEAELAKLARESGGAA
jgi:hypothetical protein